MSEISSIGSGVAAPMSMPSAPAASSTAVASSSSASSMSATSSTSLVQSSVSMMLGSIDSGLAGNDLLKMAIAMLILQTMSGQQGEGAAKPEDLLAMLGGGKGGSSMMIMEASTTAIHSEQTVSMSQAQQSYAGASMPSSGGSLNMSA